MSNHGGDLSPDALVVLYNMLYEGLVATSGKLAAFTENVVTVDRVSTIFDRRFRNHTKIR